MEQKTLSNEEIARAMMVVEVTTRTKIDWSIRPRYATRECDGVSCAMGRTVDFTVHREDGTAIAFWVVVDTEYYHSFRNSVLMKYVRYLEDYEVK